MLYSGTLCRSHVRADRLLKYYHHFVSLRRPRVSEGMAFS